MKLLYKKIIIVIKFEHPIVIRKPLIFTFRSVIGKELKKVSCLLKSKKSCEECLLNKTCPYSFYFESPEFNKGNKKPHPFALFINFDTNKELDIIKIELTLIGDKAISYFPYLYFSIVKAGKIGIFKERVKFHPQDVRAEEKSILTAEDNLAMDFPKDIWKLDDNFNSKISKNLKINFLTPARIKSHGKIIENIDYMFFLKAIFRRMKFLTEIYGENNFNNKIDFSELYKFYEQKTKFEKVSLIYYSSRQKKRVPLFGYKGFIYIKKEFTPFELSLLKASEIFGIGGSTTFGFGKISLLNKEQNYE